MTNNKENVMLTDVKILFEDKNIVACIKPRGLSSEDSDEKPNMVSELIRLTGCKEIRALHRLDKGVFGVMVYAKSKQSACAMSRLIAEGKMKKQYTCLVHGKPTQEKGVFEDLLFKDSKKNKVFVVGRERKGVKKAVLEYSVENTFNFAEQLYSLVCVTLITGRSHQIRVQFSSRHHALAGDSKYGAHDKFKNILLMCEKISFISPFDGKKTFFECPRQLLTSEFSQNI